jgi:hypothetical protein
MNVVYDIIAVGFVAIGVIMALVVLVWLIRFGGRS